ncbi:MAG: ankyrin repeat domain-containing protein [Clostridiales bacterium]|nr:ankyrin repeat domain-containing protein [Clostridiales bacterium]
MKEMRKDFVAELNKMPMIQDGNMTRHKEMKKTLKITAMIMTGLLFVALLYETVLWVLAPFLMPLAPAFSLRAMLLHADLDETVMDSSAKNFEHAIRDHTIEQVKEAIEDGAPLDPGPKQKFVPLRTAACYDLEALKYLLEKGADPNLAAFDKMTPLMYCTELWNGAASAELLLDYGADVNAKDEDGLTAMDYLFLRRWPERVDSGMFKLFIERGATVSESALASAMKNEKFLYAKEIVKILRAQDAGFHPDPCIIAAFEGDDTELREAGWRFPNNGRGAAAAFGDVELVQIAYPPKISDWPERTLSELAATAARYGNLEVLRFVLDEQPVVVEKYGLGILEEAIEGNHAGAAEYLLESGVQGRMAEYSETWMRNAAWNGAVDVMKTLISHGCPLICLEQAAPSAINGGQKEALTFILGCCPRLDIGGLLVASCEKGDLGISEYLVEQGADVNKCIPSGSPLIAAIRENHSDIIRFLLENGADPNLENDFLGATPMHVAAQYASLYSLDTLVEYGGDIRSTTNAGETTLIWAASLPGGGSRNIVNYLINHSVETNAQDRAGKTALIHASEVGTSAGVVEALLKAGVDVSIVDCEGRKAVDYARSNKAKMTVFKAYSNVE